MELQGSLAQQVQQVLARLALARQVLPAPEARLEDKALREELVRLVRQGRPDLAEWQVFWAQLGLPETLE
jgi:hypothetical protein